MGRRRLKGAKWGLRLSELRLTGLDLCQGHRPSTESLQGLGNKGKRGIRVGSSSTEKRKGEKITPLCDGARMRGGKDRDLSLSTTATQVGEISAPPPFPLMACPLPRCRERIDNGRQSGNEKGTNARERQGGLSQAKSQLNKLASADANSVIESPAAPGRRCVGT